jgi:uncharacterized cupin superfamily protein
MPCPLSVRYSLRMANIFSPEWDIDRDEPPYRWQRARLGRQAGSRQLGASLFHVEPGAETFPLHIHYANEELLVVVAGRPTLHALEGSRVLEPGEVVAFPAGREGAHRLANDGDEPARLLIVSTMHAPDINEFPELGQYWVRDYIPGTDAPEGALDVHVRPIDAES